MSAAARGNGLVGVLDIGVKSAQIAVALGPVLAQGDDSARLDQFEEIKPRGIAYFGPIAGAEPFEPRLQCRETGGRIGEGTVAAWLYRFRTRGRRRQQRQDECGRNDQPYKCEKSQDEAFQHDMIPL